MKFYLITAFFLSTTASFACDNPVEAINDYYGGFGEQISTHKVSEGLYAVSYYDTEENAQCSGGLAKVSANCQVSPVRALVCERR